jgi:hypothetical protein
MCAKLTERFEFLDRTRQISPGGSGLGRLPFADLSTNCLRAQGLPLQLVSPQKWSHLALNLAPTHDNVPVRIYRQTSHGD